MGETEVRTTCPYCGVGCGVLVRTSPGGRSTVSGDPEHPANRGRLCSKGSTLAETLSLDGRLTVPSIGDRDTSWDDALGLVARKFSSAIAEHGPDSVALYVSGQLLTEDYYAANKLMKGFIGSANIDTNSRLCMASSVAGHKRAFGADTVPGCYEDLEWADLVVLVGSNLAWCHPILYQRLAAAKAKRGTRVIVVDPRRTATCEIADQHLALEPDSDVALFNGLLASLAAADAIDRTFVERHTGGFEAALAVARQLSLADVAAATGLSPTALADFFALFRRTARVVTVYSQGVNQSATGSDKVNAIINCHLATGRIGKPGMGPFSVTGQPNAMGGREVGGLANMLAAHMELGDPEHRRIVQSFWRSPRVADKPGLKAVDLFEAVGAGRIKALWIMATNPVVSLPEADDVRAALQACPFVVVSEVERHTDTTPLAHVLLPSAAWGEKDGTVTNSERRISRQRSFLPLPADARPDWWQVAEVAKRMGFDGFGWQSAAEIFAEHAALTGAGNNGTRDLDLSAHAALTPQGYDALEPFRWPQPAGEGARERRFFADGRFFTPDRRARFVPTVAAKTVRDDGRLRLNTGRIRDQWHTMTRTAKSARLAGHIAEPFVEVNPYDAARLALAPAGLATLANDHGTAVLRVLGTDRVARGQCFVPMHWSGQFASAARVDALVPSTVDPISGQPALKHGRVDLMPFPAKWFAFGVFADRPRAQRHDYWALARSKHGWRVELAGVAEMPDPRALLSDLRPAVTARSDVLAFYDRSRGEARFAVFEGDILVAALFVGAAPVGCARSFLADQVGRPVADPAKRYVLLAGRPGADAGDAGPIVCACMEVGRNIISGAIRAGCATVEAVGAATGAGSNCGSCRAEIGALIHASDVAKAG